MSDNKCNPDICQYHALTDAIINDLRSAVHKLAEGQEQMRDTVVQLTEAFKSMDRIERKLEKMEDIHREDLAESNKKVGELRAFMYKVSGAAAVIAAVLPHVLKILGIG